MIAICSGPNKLEFMCNATKKAHPFESCCAVVPDELDATIEWLNQRKSKQVNHFRERIV